MSFYAKFWQRQTQLAALVDFVSTSGSSKPTELAKMLGKWVK